MPYFPAFIQLENRRVLLVGGGKIAKDKLEKLIDFTKEIVIVTKEVREEIYQISKDNCLTLLVRPYRAREALEYDIVVVATDTINLHRQIFEETRESRVLVNSVDNKDYCDFIFPSYLKRGDLTVIFSTSGVSPAFAKYIRQWFEELLPDGIDNFLNKMKRLRGELPKGKNRMILFDKMVKEFIKEKFPRA